MMPENAARTVGEALILSPLHLSADQAGADPPLLGADSVMVTPANKVSAVEISYVSQISGGLLTSSARRRCVLCHRELSNLEDISVRAYAKPAAVNLFPRGGAPARRPCSSESAKSGRVCRGTPI